MITSRMQSTECEMAAFYAVVSAAEKCRTGLAFYYIKNGGTDQHQAVCEDAQSSQDLYIITTARKRDTLEWEEEIASVYDDNR